MTVALRTYVGSVYGRLFDALFLSSTNLSAAVNYTKRASNYGGYSDGNYSV